MERPPEIKQSMINGNKEHLSNAGRKGAEMTNLLREIKKFKKEEEELENALQLKEDLQKIVEERNGDPID